MNTPHRIRVLIPMRALSRAGGVDVVCAVANELSGRGHEVTIIAPHSSCAPPRALHDAVRLEVIRAHSAAAYTLRVVQRIRAFEGVVVTTGYLTPLFVLFAAPRRTRAVSLIQNDEITSHIRHGNRPRWMQPALAALARFGYRLPGYRIAVSEAVATRVGRSRIQAVIHPGIHAAYTARIPSDRTVRRRHESLRVGFFPTPGSVKGTGVMIAALELLACTHSTPIGRHPARAADNRGTDDTRIHNGPVVNPRSGDGRANEGPTGPPAPGGQHPGDRRDATPVVFDLHYDASFVPPSVTRYSELPHPGAPPGTAGARDDVIRFYEACDVFVYPSLFEGFGLPPLEAMACGTAVILSDCGGPADYARDEINCLLVPPGDPQAVAAAITRLDADEGLRAQLVRGGYNTAVKRSEAAFVQSVASHIENPGRDEAPPL